MKLAARRGFVNEPQREVNQGVFAGRYRLTMMSPMDNDAHALSNEEVREAFDALLASGSLAVAFQPIVDLAAGEIAAYEVLGRVSPISGPLAIAARSPATLLDVAHAHGRLLALDRRWREIAMAAIAAHDDARHRFFINVDPRTADDAHAKPGFTLALVHRYGLDPARFVLELTEAPSRDPRGIERVLEHYAEQGFHVALDDLGSGRASLASLLRLRPHVVKLDRDVVRGIEADPVRGQLLGAVAELARRSGVAVVAEGIETEAQLEAVAAAGVTLGQGFLLGRPAPRPRDLSGDARAHLLRIRRVGSASSVVAMPRAMNDPSAHLVRLATSLRADSSLEAKLDHVTRAASALLGVDRVSLRLLDAQRAHLLVAARTGDALHGTAGATLVVGEGLAGWVAQHAEPLSVDHAERDPRFVAKPDRAAKMGAFLGVPLLGIEGCIGVLAASSPEPRAFGAEHRRWLQVVADIAAPYLDVARLQRLAWTDPLTLALNRRALQDLLPDAAAAGSAMSVLMCDLDDFKHVNDRLGHGAGDDVLRAVVRTMSSIVRRGDRTVRLGGEEFLLALPGVELAQALRIAERLREAVATPEVFAGGVITVSIGVAERRPGERRDSLLQRADVALYRAKALGKNRVVADDSPAMEMPSHAAPPDMQS